MEETTKFGPNVIAFQLVTGEDRFYVVGAYIPPSDLKTLDDVRSAWANCPKKCKPIVLGDLNINLESPCDERDETIAEEMDFCALSDMSRNVDSSGSISHLGAGPGKCVDRDAMSAPNQITFWPGKGTEYVFGK